MKRNCEIDTLSGIVCLKQAQGGMEGEGKKENPSFNDYEGKGNKKNSTDINEWTSSQASIFHMLGQNCFPL